MKFWEKIVLFLIPLLYRLWCSTLRYTQTGRSELTPRVKAGEAFVLCFWHEELFPITYLREDWPLMAMVSKSKDGEFVARLMHSFGLKTARGSSSRKGLAALLTTAHLMREEKLSACIAVDGPKGPRHQVKQGAIFLAARVPAPIVPVRLFMENPFIFKRTWDKFRLPKPFSKVHLVLGEPYTLADTELTDTVIAHECAVLAQKLNELRCPGENTAKGQA